MLGWTMTVLHALRWAKDTPVERKTEFVGFAVRVSSRRSIDKNLYGSELRIRSAKLYAGYAASSSPPLSFVTLSRVLSE